MNYSSILRFQQFVELRDYRPQTKSEYVRCLRRLADYYQNDPATLTEDDLRAYFFHLRESNRIRSSGLVIIRSALRAFFRDCLKAAGTWTVFEDLQIRRTAPLPRVLSRSEVARLIRTVRDERFRVCLKLIYHCGLRVGEAVRLRIHDLDWSRKCVRIRAGKGGRDREVPIARAMLEELDRWWKTHSHPQWLFPRLARSWKHLTLQMTRRLGSAQDHMGVSAVQIAFRNARITVGLPPECCVHTLRHCFATHLLEEGVSLREISRCLGHASLATTLIYAHLTSLADSRARSAQETLYESLRFEMTILPFSGTV